MAETSSFERDVLNIRNKLKNINEYHSSVRQIFIDRCARTLYHDVLDRLVKDNLTEKKIGIIDIHTNHILPVVNTLNTANLILANRHVQYQPPTITINDEFMGELAVKVSELSCGNIDCIINSYWLIGTTSITFRMNNTFSS